jgi:hypothetical protein
MAEEEEEEESIISQTQQRFGFFALQALRPHSSIG